MAAREPRLAKSYGANVVLVILTLFPGLINTSAVALAAPVIGSDLGVEPDDAMALPLVSDAALAFGCVLAAEMTRRLEGRTLYFWLMAVSLATSLASAVAPAFPVLLIAHVIHGLVAGMLFIVVLPPLLTTFGSAKIGATATTLVPALFGAATLGPLVGGLVAAPGTWRLIFAAEVVVALVALGLARQVFTPRPPQAADEPIDWYALVTAGLGSLLIYFGVANLAGNDWQYPLAGGPVAAGVLTYVALLVGEARKPQPLVPVRKLATSLALVGTVATVIGSATFSALTQCFELTLLRVDGLDARAAGFAFWPEFLPAVGSGFLFGRVVTTKWVSLNGASGLVLIALAALLARALSPVTAIEVTWISTIAAFGAGLSVSPGLFVVTLSRARARRTRDRVAQPVPVDRRLHQLAGDRAHDRLACARPSLRARSFCGLDDRRTSRPRVRHRSSRATRLTARDAAAGARARDHRRLLRRLRRRAVRRRGDRGDPARDPPSAAGPRFAAVRPRRTGARGAGPGVALTSGRNDKRVFARRKDILLRLHPFA
jgi:MFS family permease